MKTLVIHPDDKSTDFLKPIYKKIKDKTVITGGDGDSNNIIELIKIHDRVIMLGHGSTQGLFGINFNVDYVIDRFHVEALSKKAQNIYIWCNADKFVEGYKLKGIYSGMFISEVSEAMFCGFKSPTLQEVTNSNTRFAHILGDYITDLPFNTFNNLKEEYNKVALTNRIAKYNNERLNFIV